MTYSVVDLNEGVVDSDNVNTTVVDAIEELLIWEFTPLSRASGGATYALRKTWIRDVSNNVHQSETFPGRTYNAANAAETVDTNLE